MPGNTALYPGAAATISDLTVATNRASTTLSTAISTSASSIVVASTALFTAPCIVYIDSEAILCGTAASGTFTGVTRGFDNTTTSTHTAGAVVENLIVAYHHNQPVAEIIAIEADLKAGLPSSRGGTDQITAPSNKVLVGNGTTFAFQTYQPALTGDVTTAAQGTVTTLANIPADTPASKLLVTNVVAPSTPASGKTEVYVDSTQKILSAKNDAGSISVTVIPATGTGSQVVTGIAASGSLTFGTMTTGGTPQFSGGDVTSTASGATVLHLVSIPDATPAVGSLLFTDIVAPGTPAAGKASVYVDSTDKNLKAKADTGNITVTVVPLIPNSGTFVTGLGADGNFTVGAGSGGGVTITPVTATTGTFLTAVTTDGTFAVGTAVKPITATSGTFLTGVNAAGTFTVGTASSGVTLTPVTATAGTFITAVTTAGTFSVGTAITAVTATAGTFITGANASGTFTVGTAITAVTSSAGIYLAGVTAAGAFSVGTLTAAGTNYQTLDTAGTPLTQRPSLNFIAGTGITVLASDNSGSSRTDLTLSQAAKTVKQFISYKGAVAQNGVATLGFSTGTATASTPTATVVNGSNCILGVAAFGTNNFVQDHFVLPTDWTSTIDADIYWTSTDTAGNAVWSMALGKAISGTDTVNQAFNSATLGTSTTNATASVLNKTTLTGLTTTGLAADEEAFFKLLLSSTTMSGNIANLVSLRITLRRSF